MKHLPYSLIGGIGLLSLQSCASKQQVAEQEYPNVIYPKIRKQSQWQSQLQ